ncbi:glutamate--cysteine ligase [Lactobacillaceae bacterium Melli_B3]
MLRRQCNGLDALHYDYLLTAVLRQALGQQELLWPLSMPPVLPLHQDNEMLAKLPPKKRQYFESISARYGITQGAPCGVHINLSINQQVLAKLLHHFNSMTDLQNHIYPIVAQGFVKYRWLLTYLFGASPVAEQNYFQTMPGPSHPVRSIRQSHYGFISSFDVDYSSVDNYVDKIETALTNHEIASTAEFHGSVRFRGSNDLLALKQDGVKYIELRMFDLDPTVDPAIKTTTIRFIRLLTSYFVMTGVSEAPDGVIEQLQIADAMNERVALERPDQHCEYESKALELMANLRLFVNSLALGPEYIELLDELTAQIHDPRLTLGGQLLPQIKNHSLLNYGLKQARTYQAAAESAHDRFDGFLDNQQSVSAAELKQGLFNGNWLPK